MALTNIQDKPIVVGTPIEIDLAVNEIRKVIATLDWISHPYFIAQRFFRSKNGKQYIFPETYAPEKPGSRGYKRLTPDNDFSGMCFFMVGRSSIDYEPNRESFLNYPVSIIFVVNLELIDPVKLNNGLFTRELMSEARRLLTKTQINHDFEYIIKSETDDLQEVFREFRMKDLLSYNRAPMQTWRVELDVKIEEDC